MGVENIYYEIKLTINVVFIYIVILLYFDDLVSYVYRSRRPRTFGFFFIFFIIFWHKLIVIFFCNLKKEGIFLEGDRNVLKLHYLCLYIKCNLT